MQASKKQAEQKRVNYTIEQIDIQHELVKSQLENAHKETRAVEKNYSENASVNTFEIDDASETNAEIQQQRQLVAKVVETENILENQLTTLKNLKDSPYFGRIDIKDDGANDKDENNSVEKLYIGTSSLQATNDEFLIYDWRAPISAIYYNGTLGKVKYETPSGDQVTNLLNKRQFTIENGKIINMFDTNETVGDEMLQSALGQQNDENMQNIVATIQAEQNDIIRDTTHDLLVVQGVAGSGKTSAILQRIAFLLYHSREDLNADQILLFSPNKLFSNYIADVLPSLGERNMRQVTLVEFLASRLEGLTVQTLFERYESNQNTDNEDIKNEMASLDFIEDIKYYVNNLDEDTIKFNDIMLVDEVLFSAYHIKVIYMRQPQKASVSAKILATKNQLINELKLKVKYATDSSWVSKAVNELSTSEYEKLVGIGVRDEFEVVEDETKYVNNLYAMQYYQGVYDAIFNDYYIDIYTQYSDFLIDYGNNRDDSLLWNRKAEDFQMAIEWHKMDLDDAPGFLLMRDLLTNRGQNRKIQHLFIDEMQDYTMAQLAYFKHSFPRAQVTILGDNEQALFDDVVDIHDFYLHLQVAFESNAPKLVTLNKSYRSTKEITEFGKDFLPKDNQIQAFTRHGKKPTLVVSKTDQATLNYLKETLPSMLKEHATTAILTKNIKQAKVVAKLLGDDFELNLLSGDEKSIPKGLIVLPIYLAKGLEFDCVVAYGVNDEIYSTKNDASILYTVATRAMHDLLLITDSEDSKILANIDHTLYEKISAN